MIDFKLLNRNEGGAKYRFSLNIHSFFHIFVSTFIAFSRFKWFGFHTAQYFFSSDSNNKDPNSPRQNIFWFAKLGFLVFVLCYVFGILWRGNFAIIDDHTLVNTLLAGKSIPLSHFVMPQIGRFFPLSGQDLNILSFLFGASAGVFYGFIAVCVLMLAFMLVYALSILLQAATDAPKSSKIITLTAYGCVALILLSPSFISSFLRLFVPERMESVFLGIFLACFAYLYVCKTKAAYLAIGIGALSATIALFYKETAFILLGSFSFMHFILLYKNTKLDSKIIFRLKLLDMLVLLGCMVWIISYYVFVVARKTTQGSYADTLHDPLMLFVKNFINYAMNEPLLFIAVPIAFLYRCVHIIRDHKTPLYNRFNPLLDASLFAVVLFLCAYMVLNISDVHYPLPGYIIGSIALGILGLQLFSKRHTLGFIYKVLLFIITFILIANVLPYSIHRFALYKFTPENFQSTLAFMHSMQNDTLSKQTQRIFLDGIDCTLREKGEVCHSFKIWLGFYGVHNSTILPDIDRQNPLRKGKQIATQKQAGDIVILTPYTSNNINSAYIRELDSRYERLYHADFGWNVGFVGLKSLIKYTLLKRGNTQAIFSENTWNLPLYFYVYRVTKDE